jgi:hypothetical protein
MKLNWYNCGRHGESTLPDGAVLSMWAGRKGYTLWLAAPGTVEHLIGEAPSVAEAEQFAQAWAEQNYPLHALSQVGEET